MEREDGEMSDDNNMLVDNDNDLQSPVTKSEDVPTVMFKADKHGLVIQQLEKVDAFKLQERAKRFGLELTGRRTITEQQIDDLYTNFGIESGNKRHFRFDTVHLNGVQGLSTREIFEYMEDFRPVSLEWIDDVSCNIVCQDHISAALALLVHSREIKSDDIKDALAKKSKHHWREGVPHPKNDLIFMRFATNGDKKMNRKKPTTENTDEYYDEEFNSVSKNPWGDLCKSWGVYDHQEVFHGKAHVQDDEYDDDEEDDDRNHLPPRNIEIKNKKLAMRLGKRSLKTSGDDKSEDSDSDSEWKKKSKAPRMRMHADDVEDNQRKRLSPSLHRDRENSNEKEYFSPLSVEVVNSHKPYAPRHFSKLSDKFKTKSDQRPSIQSRLGSKITPQVHNCSSDESSVDSIDYNVSSRVEKITSKTNTANVWSRLQSKNHSEEEKSDLRNVLKSRRHKNRDDLRDRLSKSKTSNLRIEIDNNYAKS